MNQNNLATKITVNPIYNLDINALIELKDPRSVDLLITALKDSNWTIHRSESAKQALDKIDPDWNQTDAARQLVPYFIDAMGKNHTPHFREMAVNALGYLQDPRAVEPLIAAMVDDDTTDVPWRAASTLGKLNDSRAVEPLIAAMLDSTLSSSVDLNAAIALGKLNDIRAVEPLIAALKIKGKSDWFREYVTRSLRNITHRGFAEDYDNWNNWWLENKETFLQEWQQKYSGEKK